MKLLTPTDPYSPRKVIDNPAGIKTFTYKLVKCWKFVSPGCLRLPVLGQGYLIQETGSPWGATKNEYISASIGPTALHNHSKCSAMSQINRLKHPL